MKCIDTVFALLFVVGTTTALADDNHSRLLLEAETLARQSTDLPDGSKARKELTTKVKSLVTKSFDARQDSQRQQIQKMKEMLRKAETLLEDRAKIRERIIDRKVEDLLSDQSAEWTESPNSKEGLFDVIGIGDIVAVYLPGVLPFDPPNAPATPPQVNLLRSGRPVSGYPLAVGSDGAISMPLVAPIEVAGLNVRQAEAKIAKAYVEQDILRPEKARPTLTLIPKEEFPQPTDVTPDSNLSQLRATVDRPAKAVGTGVSSFDDTYGRISGAAESLATIAALEREIGGGKDRLRLNRNDASLKRSVLAAEQQLSLEKLKLKLVKDYLNDEIEQSKIDLQAKYAGLQAAEQDHARREMLFKSGAMTASELAPTQLQIMGKKAQIEIAELTLARYQKTLAQWTEIVGDTISDDDRSE